MDVMFIQASYFVFLTLANAADNSSSDEFIRFRKKTKSDFRKKDSQYSDFWDLEIIQVILYVKERKFKLFKDIYEDFICAFYESEIYDWLRNKLVPIEIPQVDETEVLLHCDGTNCTYHAKLLKKKSNAKNKKIEKFVNKMQRRVLRIQKAAMTDCEDFIFDSSDEGISKSNDKSSDEVISESSDNSSCSDCKRVHRCKIGNYPGVDMEKFRKEMAVIDEEIRQDSNEGFYYQSDKKCNCMTKYLDNIAIIIEYIIIIHIGTFKYFYKITSHLTRSYFIRSRKPITQTEHAEILQDFTDFSSDLCVIVAEKLDIFKNISNRLIDILRSKYLDNAVLCDMNDSPDDKQKIKHNEDVKAIEQKENPHIQNTVSTMAKKNELQKTASDANKKLVYYLPTSLYGHYDDFEGVFSNFENKLLQHSADTCIEFDEKPENFSPFYNAYEDFAGCYDDDCYNDFKTLVENAQEIGKSITIEEVVKMRERKPFLLNRSNLFLVKSIKKLNMDCMEVLSRLFNSKEKCLDTNGIREITIETMIDMANAIIIRIQKLRNKLDRTYYTDYDFIIDLMKKFCADIIDSCKKTSKIPADSNDTFEYVVSCKLMCVSFYIKGIRPIWRCCRGNARSIPRRMIQNSNAFTDPNKAKDVIELNGGNTTYDAASTSNKGKFPRCDMNINPENIVDASTNDSDDTFYNEESSSICNEKENNFGKNKSSNNSKNTQFYLYISCLLFISMICSVLLWYKGKNNK